MNVETLGKNIRKARKAAGLTQDDVEVRTGIHKPRLSRYENGLIMPNLESIEILAKALRVTPKSLVGWK